MNMPVMTPGLIAALSATDPQVLLILLTPVAIAGAAWVLQIACSFSLVEAPHYWHATALIISIVIANLAVRFFLGVTHIDLGLSTQYAIPAIVYALVLTIGLPTNPVSGLMVTVIHVVLCSVLYLGGVIVATSVF